MKKYKYVKKCPDCEEEMTPEKNDRTIYYYCWNCGKTITVATIAYSSD